MLEINKIHQGDCMELMKQIPDGSVDMILCDLPYGVTRCEWDTLLPLEELWQHYKRILKDTGVVVLTATQPFVTDLINSNREWFKYTWIWNKIKSSGCFYAKYQPIRILEEILVFYNQQPTYNPILTDKPKSFIRKNNIDMKKISNIHDNELKYKRIDVRKIPIDKSYPKNLIIISAIHQMNKKHPSEKPLELFEYLIKTYSNEDDLVLDNCMGSGTTAVAAKQLGRNFIGIELNSEYCEIARERLKQSIL